MTHEHSQFYDSLTIAVAKGSTAKAAAAEVGCSLDHAYQLSRTREFRASVADIRTAAIESAVSKIASVAEQAVETLQEALKADRPTDRINAAKAILASILPLSENLELRRRLEELEQGFGSKLTND